jgi:hypothetical protein
VRESTSTAALTPLTPMMFDSLMPGSQDKNSRDTRRPASDFDESSLRIRRYDRNQTSNDEQAAGNDVEDHTRVEPAIVDVKTCETEGAGE